MSFRLIQVNSNKQQQICKNIHTKQYFIYLSCLGFSDIGGGLGTLPRITSGEIIQLMDLKGVFFLLSPYFLQDFSKKSKEICSSTSTLCVMTNVCPQGMPTETDGLILLEIILKVSAILPVHCGQP